MREDLANQLKPLLKFGVKYLGKQEEKLGKTLWYLLIIGLAIAGLCYLLGIDLKDLDDIDNSQ